MDSLTLKDALLALMAGGGGVIVFLLMENVAWLKSLRPDYKRYVSWALSGAIPILAWGAMLLMGYEPLPTTWQAVVERLFALLAIAFTASQGLHAAKRLNPTYLAEHPH